MDNIILYPTETVYGLGVNALSESALETLFKRKSRDIQKTVSWLVRNVDDIARYAELSPKALAISPWANDACVTSQGFCSCLRGVV